MSIDRLIFLLFLYLPLCMSGHLLVNHFIGRPWTWFSAFLYPEGALTFCLFVATMAIREARTRLRERLDRKPRLRLVVLLAGGFVIWTAVCSVLQKAPGDFWSERLLAGWVFPMLAAAVLLGRPETAGVDAAFKGLRIGLVILLPLQLSLYVASFGIPSSFRELALENRTWRMSSGLRRGIYFGELTLGGINDVAVFFAVALAAAAGLFALRRRLSRGAYALLVAWTVLALSLEFLCYSRGAILGLIFVGVASGLLAVRGPRLRSLLMPAALIFAFAVGVVWTPEARSYWLGQATVEKGSTAWIRWKLWSSVEKANADPKLVENPASARGEMSRGTPATAPIPSPVVLRVEEASRKQLAARTMKGGRQLLLGFGLGNYGVLQGMTLEFPTHNMFLDAFVNSGIPGMILFTAFWGTFLLAAVGAARREVGRPPAEWRDPPMLGIAAAGLVLTLVGITVTFLFWNLGTMLNGTLVWLLVVLAVRDDSGGAVVPGDPLEA